MTQAQFLADALRARRWASGVVGAAMVAASTAGVLAVLSACGGGYPTGPEAEQLVVHGMLVVGAPTQEVLVERARAIDEGFLRPPTGVEDADITVEGGDGRVHRFLPVADSAGYYRAEFVPGPGEMYTLRLVTGDGRTAEARTRTPGAPLLVRPATDTLITGPASIQFVWRPATGAGYLVTYGGLSGRTPSYLIAELLYYYSDVVADTVAAALVGSPFSYPNGAAIAVASVDSAYARYVSPLPVETEPRSSLRSNVQGGLGLFGSSAFSDDRRVTVVEP